MKNLTIRRKNEEKEKILNKMNSIVDLRRSLDDQLNQKKKFNEFEKKIDKEQGIIFHKDADAYKKIENEVKDITTLDVKKVKKMVMEQIKENEIKKLQENTILRTNEDGFEY